MAYNKLKLKKIANARDLGGFKTADGKTIIYGKLIRSSRLYKLPKKTVKALENLNLSYIVDLRVDEERLNKPDTKIGQTKYLSLPILCSATPAITEIKSMRQLYYDESQRIEGEFGTAENYMCEVYKIMLTSEQSKKAIKEIFNKFLEGKGILWHCNSGKDRAGIIAMLIEGALGVPEQTIIQDYITTQKYTRAKRFGAYIGLKIIFTSSHFKHVLRNLLSAKRLFITSTLDFLDKEYGGIAGYLKKEIGLTNDDFLTLRKNYLA